MKKLVFDKEDGEFVVEFELQGTHWLNFRALECVSTFDSTGIIPTFLNYDVGNGVYSQQDINDFDKYWSNENNLCTGFIKWDGCMEIHGFSHHFCGYDNFMQNLMKVIYQAAAMIPSFDKELANYEQIS